MRNRAIHAPSTPPVSRLLRRLALRAICVLAISTLAGCDLPHDNRGSLDRARDGELRVGVVNNPPWVRVADGRVGGIEPALVRAWSAQLGARIQWIPGDLASHVHRLRNGDLDVLLAGFTSRTPFAPQIALTRSYLKSRSQIAALARSAGTTALRGDRVMATSPGESAMLFSLDRYLTSLGTERLGAIARREAGTERQ